MKAFLALAKIDLKLALRYRSVLFFNYFFPLIFFFVFGYSMHAEQGSRAIQVITMVTAIASLLTRRPVKGTVGMTGEVTLQGRVLPIGGLKQKVLAAHAAGLTEVIVPERNQPDLDDVPAEVRDQMQFHIVASVDQVLALALEPTGLALAA